MKIKLVWLKNIVDYCCLKLRCPLSRRIEILNLKGSNKSSWRRKEVGFLVGASG